MSRTRMRGGRGIGRALLWMASLALASTGAAQTPSRAELLGVAREVVEGAAFVSLATLDEAGYPAVRAMDPLPPDEDWVVWLATNPDSRKVAQLRARPRVALHYLAAGVPAYVTLIGRARLVDEPETKARHWKDSWTPFYPDRDQSVLLIEVTPIRLEVVSEAHGAPGDPETWRAHVVEFGGGATTGSFRPSDRGRPSRALYARLPGTRPNLEAATGLVNWILEIPLALVLRIRQHSSLGREEQHRPVAVHGYLDLALVNGAVVPAAEQQRVPEAEYLRSGSRQGIV